MTETHEHFQSSVKDLGPTRKEIEAQVGAEDAAREYDRILEGYALRPASRAFAKGRPPRTWSAGCSAPIFSDPWWTS